LLAARLDDSVHECLFSARLPALWVWSAPCGGAIKCTLSMGCFEMQPEPRAALINATGQDGPPRTRPYDRNPVRSQSVGGWSPAGRPSRSRLWPPSSLTAMEAPSGRLARPGGKREPHRGFPPLGRSDRATEADASQRREGRCKAKEQGRGSKTRVARRVRAGALRQNAGVQGHRPWFQSQANAQ